MLISGTLSKTIWFGKVAFGQFALNMYCSVEIGLPGSVLTISEQGEGFPRG